MSTIEGMNSNSLLLFLADFDCCHTHPMITMPIGCKIKLDATNREVSILEY